MMKASNSVIRSTIGRLTSPIGLRSRLLLIALIPILGLLAGAINRVVDRSNQSQTASVIEAQVDALVETIDAQTALDAELLPTEAIRAGKAFGIPNGIVSQMIGFDVDERMTAARPVTDKAVSSARFARIRNLIVEIRASAFTSVTRPADNASNTKDSLDELGRTWLDAVQELNSMRRNDLGQLRETVKGDPELGATLENLLRAEEVVSSYGATNLTLFELSGSASEQRELRRKLAVETAIADRAIEALQETSGPGAREKLKLLTSAQEYGASIRILNTTLANPGKPLIADLPGAATKFRTLLVRSDLSQQLLAASADDLRKRAEASRQDAQQALVLNVSLSLLVSFLAAMVALVVARTISRPLVVLAQRADQVAQGVLGDEPLRVAGPKEVRKVTRALNDLIANLTTLDRQVDALAQGNLDASELNKTVAGGLGASVRRTVDRLSSSIRSREELQHQLAYDATHDPLTQLANRQSILDSLKAATSRSERYGGWTACLFIDLDHFKRVNDAFGHAVGDQVLIAASKRLSELIRSVDTLGRLGGDEFVVIADRLNNPEDAITLGRRIVEVLSEPFDIDGRVCVIGGSVGIALATDSRLNTADVLQNADLAVYRAKRLGRGSVEVFDDALRAEMERRSEIEVAFRYALTNGELSVAYQPILEVGTGAANNHVVGFEALIRWHRSNHGPVSPAEFVPVLETGPQIVDLGRFVLREALCQLAMWRATKPTQLLTMSINLSGRQLAHADIVNDVLSALDHAQIPPSSLILELTETALLGDLGAAQERLGALRAAGVRIALDDFGTGFTSISQLALLPIDIVKIDRTFVSQLADESRRPIVQMMIAVGHALGIRVVAEGVETASESEALIELGCSVHQGWLYGKAVSADVAVRIRV